MFEYFKARNEIPEQRLLKSRVWLTNFIKNSKYSPVLVKFRAIDFYSVSIVPLACILK